jgi:hypothetical protein
MEYFKYSGVNTAGPNNPSLNCTAGYNCEIVGGVDIARHPPYHFGFQAPAPIGFRSMVANCPIVNQPAKNLYWFDPNTGVDLGSTNPPSLTISPPSEFTVSQQMRGVKGFTVKGYPFGDASQSGAGSAASAIMYFTDRRCSDGNNEYGLNYDLVKKTLLFYYSIKTNCYAGAGCRTQDSFSSPPQNQEDGDSALLTDLQNASPNPPAPLFYFSVYFVPDSAAPGYSTGYKFRVQVVDGYDTTQLARCRVAPGAPLGPCTTDVGIKDLFPAALVQGDAGGYIVVGTSTSFDGNPAHSPVFAPIPTFFDVQGVWSAFSSYGDLPPTYIPPVNVEAQMQAMSATDQSWDVWNSYYLSITNVQIQGPEAYVTVDPSQRTRTIPLADWWNCTQLGDCSAAAADYAPKCVLTLLDVKTSTPTSAATGLSASVVHAVGDQVDWSVGPAQGGSYPSSYAYYWNGTKNGSQDLFNFGPADPSAFNGPFLPGSQGTYTRQATVVDSTGSAVCTTGVLTVTIF